MIGMGVWPSLIPAAPLSPLQLPPRPLRSPCDFHPLRLPLRLLPCGHAAKLAVVLPTSFARLCRSVPSPFERPCGSLTPFERPPAACGHAVFNSIRNAGRTDFPTGGRGIAPRSAKMRLPPVRALTPLRHSQRRKVIYIFLKRVDNSCRKRYNYIALLFRRTQK